MSLGPAGTGKSYLAVSVAVTMLMEKKIDRVILSRPAVEAGERLGFLPGDMKEKVDPYLRPLYDALYDLFGYEQIQRKIESGSIEIAPLAFMRGRTLKNSFAILDEAQNATLTQIKMFLTRIGENSKLVVNGDPSQIDLINKNHSGLIKYLIDLHPNIEIVASKVAIKFLEDQIHKPFKSKAVKSGEELNLGINSIGSPLNISNLLPLFSQFCCSSRRLSPKNQFFASDDVLFRSKRLGSKIYTPIRFLEFFDASNRPTLSSILKSLLCQNIDRNFVIFYSRFGML